jgi:MoxR-like ATPase
VAVVSPELDAELPVPSGAAENLVSCARRLLDAHGLTVADLSAVAGPADIDGMIAAARAVHVAPSLKGYIVDLAEATRAHPRLALGMSPRAALALQRAARARAASLGREYVTPDDLKALAIPVLEHRLLQTPEAQLDGSDAGEVLQDILETIPVPTTRGGR